MCVCVGNDEVGEVGEIVDYLVGVRCVGRGLYGSMVGRGGGGI